MSAVTWAVNAAARTGEGEFGEFHAELSPSGATAVEVRIRNYYDGELEASFIAASVAEAQQAAERRLLHLVEEDLGADEEDLAAALAAIKGRRS